MNFDKNAVVHFGWGEVYFRIDEASEEIIGPEGSPVIQLGVSLADKNGHQRKDGVTIFQDYNDENSPFVQIFTASKAKRNETWSVFRELQEHGRLRIRNLRGCQAL